MKAVVLPLLFWVASVSARGVRIHGSGSSIDNWDAPGILKATMAFQILWCIAMLALLLQLIKNLRLIPTMRPRAPYIMLTIITTMLALAYLLWAVETRMSQDATYTVLDGLGDAVSFFFAFAVAFLPGTMLYMAHQRAFILRASQGKAVKPLAAQFWKRILDWSLVAITFLLYISLIAIAANEDALIDRGSLNIAAYYKYSQARLGFSHTVTAMIVLLAIDVFVTLLTLWISQRRHQLRDPVITRLLVLAFPFLAIYTLEKFVLEIYLGVITNAIDEYALDLAEVIIEGVCQIGMITAIISTMAIPGVQWVPAAQPTMPSPGLAQHNQPAYSPGWVPPAQLSAYQQGGPQPYSIPMTVTQV